MTDSLRRVWTGLIRVGPHTGDQRIALRAGVSVAVPLLAMWALGRLDLSVYASFGAFTALYGRHDVYIDRIRMQAAVGGILVASMLIGTALSVAAAPDMVRVVVVALVAALVTLIAYVWRWHPPGALFAVFAAGTCATLPATAATFGEVAVVGGLSALFALAVTVTITLARGGMRRRPLRGLTPVGAVAWEMAVTVGVGALLAGAAGLMLVGTHWYWAMVGAVAALGGAHVTARLARGAQRLIGTLIGVLLAAGLLALGLPPLAIIAIAIALQVAAELFVGRNYGIAMVFVTPLALLMVQLAVPADPALLLRDRVLDTLIGVTVGTLVAITSAMLRRSHSTRRGSGV